MTSTDPPTTAARLDATVPVNCDECPRGLGSINDEPHCQNTDSIWCLERIVRPILDRSANT